jgi:hypothetical protein
VRDFKYNPSTMKKQPRTGFLCKRNYANL